MVKETILKKIIDCKIRPEQYVQTFTVEGRTFSLEPFGNWAKGNAEYIKLITNWRRKHQIAFPSIFDVTFQGTNKWFQSQVINNPERILFGLFDQDRCLIGHVGLSTFDFGIFDCEIDNVMKGDPNLEKGVLREATRQLVDFAYTVLEMSSVSLRVFGDNYRAIRLYQNCDFSVVDSIPMTLEFEGDTVHWREVVGNKNKVVHRIFIKMVHTREN